MQVVILAAGKGVRLQPLTILTPKPMLRVANTPILERTLSSLPSNISEIFLVVGYLKEKIQDYFGKEFQGIPIRYLEQENLDGTFGALRLAEPFLGGEPFLVLNGDDLYLREDLLKLATAEGELKLLVKEVSDPRPFGVCLLSPDGCYLQGIIEKPENQPANLINIGAYLLDRNIFRMEVEPLPNGERYLAPAVGKLAAQKKIRAIPAIFWLPIGSIEDLEEANRICA